MTKALWLALALALAGCAALEPQAGQSRRIDDMIAGVLQTCQGTPEAQRHELAQARRAFAARDDDLERLRLAVLLATLPAPLRDDAQSATLLKPLAARDSANAVTRFASLLAIQLAERRRLDEKVQRRQQALISALHGMLSALQRRQGTVMQSEQRANDLQQRVNDLQQKLDALEAIERQALDREQQLQ
jgi:hypothetical protein